MNNYNNQQDLIDICRSFDAFADIQQQASLTEPRHDTPFTVKEHAAFGEFTQQSQLFPY